MGNTHNPEKSEFRGRSYKKGGENVRELRDSEEWTPFCPNCADTGCRHCESGEADTRGGPTSE